MGVVGVVGIVGPVGKFVQIFWGRIEGREIPLKIVRKIKKDFHDLSFDLERQNFVENNNFPCESCDASFNEDYLLKKHVLNNHKGNTYIPSSFYL